jgi:putative glutathione S-transferase
MSQTHSSQQRRAATISTCHMRALGVRLPFIRETPRYSANRMTAHRALIVRKLKGLEDIIPYTSVHWEMLEKGWRFATSEDNEPGEHVEPDPIHKGFTHLRDVYFDVNKDYEGRFTVPTLYDTKQKTIVSNESSEIIRMFYTEFDHLLDDKYKNVVLLPEDLKSKIEETNEWTYNDINNGVYKSGFARYALLRHYIPSLY